MKTNMKWLTAYLTGLLLVSSSCSEQPRQDDELAKQDAALTALAGNLKAIDDEFVPPSVSDESTQVLSKASGSIRSKAESDDICGTLDFIECQPRLLRFYIRTARLTFGFSRLIVLDVARGMGGIPDGSTGSIHIAAEDVTVNYRKTSFLDFELLLKKANRSVGFIKVEPGHYELRFDIATLEAGNPDSKGGKIAIDVEYLDQGNWNTEITVTDTLCDPENPDDPEAAYLNVSRIGGLWKGLTTFYHGASARFDQPLTCDSPASDQNSMTIYTDFVANKVAAKAALYFMRRNETSMANVASFGLNGLCGKYPDLCQSLGVSLGLPADTAGQTVANHFSQFVNSYCAQRGSRDIQWNNTCSAVAPEVADAPLQNGSSWMAPSVFSQLSISIPDAVN